ncbi:MAG: GerMN domain-containing protein [Candidatus Krumholzibacteria bacterium]|nr:GerMN domain-containing protein [Candidatus Krumholzibacteria bacterium]
MTDEIPRQRPRTSVRRSKLPKKSRKKSFPSSRWLWFVVIVAVAGAGWWFLRPDVDEVPDEFADLETGSVVDSPVSGDRAVVLVYPEWDASGYVTEERQIPSRDRPGEDLFGLITVLCEGPKISGAISAMPKGTRTLGAFVNPQDQSVVLDFSQELVTGHPGGSAAEVATLTSILRTVALNFPGTRSCVILIEGAQVETLAGNLDMIRPFDPRRWL